MKVDPFIVLSERVDAFRQWALTNIPSSKIVFQHMGYITIVTPVMNNDEDAALLRMRWR